VDTSNQQSDRTARHVVVVAGGDAPRPTDLADLVDVDLVIAADSGANTSVELGLTPDVVIGDLDSIAPGVLDRLEQANVTIDRHPTAKDAGDLELALDAAVSRGATRITVVGGGRGRLSHLLTNAALVAIDRAGVTIRWRTPAADVHVLHTGDDVTITGVPDDLVTLLPVGDAAEGVTTRGLRWALDDASLRPGSSRGLSNELTATTATVALGRGTLLVIHERQNR
jgi:thiamine pyrophosphokinase